MPRKKKKVEYEKLHMVSKTANVLVIAAIALLLINSIMLVLLREQVMQEINASGVQVTPSSLALMGLMWLIIAFFSWSLNRTIKEKESRIAMWELFILSFVALLSGRLESGVLLLIASVIYLVKTKNIKKMVRRRKR